MRNMRLATFPTVFKKDVRAAVHALGRLEEEQGLIARRNARTTVLGALRRLRNHVDELFPPIKKVTPAQINAANARVSRRRLSAQEKDQRAAAKRAKANRRWTMKGYTRVDNRTLLLALSQAGIRPRGNANDAYLYAPEWAVVAARSSSDGTTNGTFNMAKVKELKKSVKARKAFLAAHRLGFGLAKDTE